MEILNNKTRSFGLFWSCHTVEYEIFAIIDSSLFS